MRPVVTAEKPLAKRYVDDYIYRLLNRPNFLNLKRCLPTCSSHCKQWQKLKIWRREYGRNG